MTAYQCIDPASGLPANRVPVADVTGHFLCRRVRSSFSRPAIIDLLGECRRVVCDCGARFDAQILTIENIATESVDLIRCGDCPECGGTHHTRLQFRRNGLILSREEGQWYIWLNRVMPNRYGNLMEEHLFWYLLDWSKRNCELAEELNVPDEVIRSWRRKLAKSSPPTQVKRSRQRSRIPQNERGRSST